MPKILPRLEWTLHRLSPAVVDVATDLQRAAWSKAPEKLSRKFDALVLGGGLSSCAAAIAIADAGFQVGLVEETHMLGGQASAAGVSAFDITFRYDHAINDYGLWSKIVNRLMSLYRDELKRPINAGHYKNISITPNVVAVERVLTEMLAESGVTVLRNTKISEVNLARGTFKNVRSTAGNISAAILLDGSELGTGAVMAGVPHYVGTSVSNGNSFLKIGKNPSRIQDITYTCTVRRYEKSIPEDLRLRTPPPDYQEILPKLRIHFPPDGNVDPQLRKPGPHGFAGYRGAPDIASATAALGSDWGATTRTNINYKNDLETKSTYLSDEEDRRSTDRRAIYQTLSILYYLQNELGTTWAVCTDEGFDGGIRHPAVDLVDECYQSVVKHFPVIPYIRESNRIVGLRTVTGKTIWRPRNASVAPWDVQSVVTGTYPPDLHGGREPEDFEAHLGETIEDKPGEWREGPFPIPLGCLIPKTVDGYIALEKNISASRIASGAVRLHPTAVGIGEAGGMLAVACLKRGVSPREVPSAIVQWLLVSAGALVTPLGIKGVQPTDPRYPAVALAVARNKMSWSIEGRVGAEPAIVTDVDHAFELGKVSGAYLERWLASGRRELRNKS